MGTIVPKCGTLATIGSSLQHVHMIQMHGEEHVIDYPTDEQIKQQKKKTPKGIHHS